MSESKVYMFPDSGNCNGGMNSMLPLMAMNGGMNGQWNNPLTH